MSISTRIQAIEQHLTDDYNVLEVAGADLTNVNKNILNLKTTWKERLLYFMNNGTDVVWNNWEKVVGEGTTITLNNTEEAPMKIVLKGNTLQNGTPTPETPQDIHVVSGDNSIEVKGKNLLKNKATSQTINGVVFTVYDDGSVKTEGTATANTALPITGANNVFVDLGLQNGTYRLSGATGGAEKTWAIYMAIKHSDNTTATFYNTNGDLVFTKTTGDTFFSVIRIENGTTVNQMFYPMIRVSSVLDNTYKPYIGASYPITLPEGMFLGWIPNTTYTDRIFQAKTGDTYYDSLDSTTKESLTYGKWYLKKEIGKVVLNGSESGWANMYLNNQGLGTITVNLDGLVYQSNNSGICNYFIYKWVYNNPTPCFYVYNEGNRGRVMFITQFTTKQDFLTWLSTHNTIVYYVLSTPTYTEITDSTLLSQLNALAKSYASQTNISQNNNDLASILNATALKEMS